MLRKTLVTAERSADAHAVPTRREAERIVREAEQTAREIGAEAHHERERAPPHEIIRLAEKVREFRARFRAWTRRDQRGDLVFLRGQRAETVAVLKARTAGRPRRTRRVTRRRAGGADLVLDTERSSTRASSSSGTGAGSASATALPEPFIAAGHGRLNVRCAARAGAAHRRGG